MAATIQPEHDQATGAAPHAVDPDWPPDSAPDFAHSPLMNHEFLAAMSHELKNPLNLMQIMVEMLARSPQTRDIPLVQHATDTIKRTIAGQAQIINDLLDLSRVNAGKLTAEPAATLLAPLLAPLLDAFRATTDAKKQTLALEVTPGLQAWADPVRVEQIVWNLVSNASKFTPEGGHIQVNVIAEGPRALIVVADDGPGIAPALLPTVFELYRQAGTPGGMAKGSLGIGLALVKRLAVLQGGDAAAESNGPGQGATFKVWLPRPPVPAP